MKKRFAWYLLLLLFVAASAFVLLKGKKGDSEKESDYSQLLPRKTSPGYTAEWAVIKNNTGILLQKIQKNPADIKSLMALTAIYLQEARITGNFNYYNKAAIRNINKTLGKDGKNFEALTFKATILLSQHRFEEALKAAEQVRQLYPYNAYVYGLLVDANIESGKYEEALEAAEQMISIRPDIRSYSRIAYLREIHGDLPGAIEAMLLAIDAGTPGDENTEWCRVQLGKLYEKTGKINEAEMHYAIAEKNRQNYPYALAGLAGIAAGKKDYPKAISLYQQADSLLPDHTFKEGIAEVYNQTLQMDKAKSIADQILKYMKEISGNGKKGEGQNEDHEMAHAYMGVGNYDKALEYALAEYKRRPANIEVNETVAVVYYLKGNYTKAVQYIETALKTNCRNPELLCYAGLILAKAGKGKEATIFLREAFKNNPAIPAELEKESKAMLKSLL